MDHGVSDPFGGEKDEGGNGQSDLEALGIQFSLGEGLRAPLRGRLVAQAPHFCDDIEIDDGPEESEKHHGNADGVLMESTSWRVDPGRSGESGQTNCYAQATDGDDGCTSALENGKHDAGPIDERNIDQEHLPPTNVCARLSSFHGVLSLFGHFSSRFDGPA